MMSVKPIFFALIEGHERSNVKQRKMRSKTYKDQACWYMIVIPDAWET
jgi:hypothetical protein